MRWIMRNERPQVVAQGIRLGRFTVKSHSVIVCCVLRRLRILNRLHGMDATRGGNRAFRATGVGGSDPLPAELRQFRHCFQAALNA